MTTTESLDISSNRRRSEDSLSDAVSHPDSAIDIGDPKGSPKLPLSSKPRDPSGKKTIPIKLPDLHTSIMAPTAALNPHLDSSIPKEADEWARDTMSLSPQAFTKHQKAQLPLLAAGFVPHASAHGFRIMCLFMEWVFYFDDLFDEGHLREDPTAARNELEAHLSIHDASHPPIPANVNPVRHMYQTVWQQIKEVSSEEMQRRYVQGMRHYFEGCMTQVDAYYWHTKHGYSPPTFDMFWRCRTHSVGCRPCEALLEPLHGIELPEEVLRHPMIKEAEDTATVITFLHNDILSYRKEQAELEAVPHNTIHVLMRERGLGLQEAFDFSGELLRQAGQRWYWTQMHLPSFGEGVDVQVQRYLEGLLDQARANLHWSFASGRYFGKDSEEARRTMVMDIPAVE